MSNPTIRDFSLLLLLASTATGEQPCTGDDAESCKVENTARLTWTLLGVLMLTNMLLLCLLCLAYCHLRRKIRQLSHKIGIINEPSRMHVFTNENPEYGLSEDPVDTAHKVSTALSTMNTSVSEPISFLHAKSARDSGDYSTVVDAIIVSSKGRMQSVSKKCPPRLKHSKSQTSHPFSGASATNAANKSATKPLRVAPPVPIAKQRDGNPRPIGELEHSYDLIVDGSSPVDGDIAGLVNTSPPHNSTAAKKTTATNTTTTTAETATTTTATVEVDGHVYSTPIAGGMKHYRRMTATQNMNKIVKGATGEREQYQHTRPQSALGVYPPLDSDIYTSSCNSSPSSIRKKFSKSRPVSAHYNEPV